MPDDQPREQKHKPGPPLDEVAAALVERFSGSVAVDSHGQPVVQVDRAAWHDVARFLRD